MRKIVIPFVKGGGGHRATALAIAEITRRQQRDWEFELLDVDEVLEPVDPIWLIFRIQGGEIYNWTLRHGLTLGHRFLVAVMHGAYRLLHPGQVLVFRRRWRKMRPDMVLSVTPHVNRALFESLKKEMPGTPLVTLLTDIADTPPRFWFEPQEQHFICGSDRALEQGLAIVGSKDRVHRVSGMVLHPKFHESKTGDRAAERKKLGLDPDLPTGLVLFGGFGSRSMVGIARHLARGSIRVQLIFLCGRNPKLARKLRALELPFPFYVQEFTDDVVHFMWLSDFFIGKPGPASISEALAMHLPVIVQHGIATLYQERYNVKWIEEQGVGIPVKRNRDMPQAIADLLEPTTYRRMRQRIEQLNNRAIFEVPEILEELLEPQRQIAPVIRHEAAASPAMDAGSIMAARSDR